MKKYTVTIVCFLCITFSFGQENTIHEKPDVAFSVVEQTPVYPGCKGNTNAVLKKCTAENIKKTIQENFKIKSITRAQAKIDGKSIGIVFKIDEDGNPILLEITTETQFLREEAIRVFNLLPQMQPGLQRGKPIGVLYGIPIGFEIENNRKRPKKN